MTHICFLPFDGRRRRRVRSRCRGFVLLTALLFTALIGLALVGLARHSMRLALQSLDAESSLQRHWGSVSIERTLLGRAATLLVENEPRSNRENWREGVIELAGVSYAVRLASESAKVNLNSVAERFGLADTETTARRLAGRDVGIALAPQENERDVERLESFSSWGEVFDYASVRTGDSIAGELMRASNQISCWGDGRLDVRVAADESILALAELAIGPTDARRLLEALRNQPDTDLERIIASLGLRAERLRRLRPLLAAESQTFSLWLEARSTFHSRWSFRVMTTAENETRSIQRFFW